MTVYKESPTNDWLLHKNSISHSTPGSLYNIVQLIFIMRTNKFCRSLCVND